MPEHPIEARARAKAKDMLKYDGGDMQTGFCLGARFGYDAAKEEFTKALAAVEQWRIAAAALDICDYFERLGCDADITDEMTNTVIDIITEAMTKCGHCNGDGHGDSRSYENGVMVRADKCPQCNGTGKTEAGNV